MSHVAVDPPHESTGSVPPPGSVVVVVQLRMNAAIAAANRARERWDIVARTGSNEEITRAKLA